MKNSYWFGIMLAMIVISQLGLAQQQPTTDQERQSKIDSLLKTYSVEEILRYRELYQKRINDLKEDKLKLREKGIHDAETFIANNPDSKILDKVFIRLAELYYEVAEDEYMQQMQVYDQQLEELGAAAASDSTLKEPVKDFSKSLALYQRIIDEFPHSDLVDDALYNKAFILEESGEIQVALEIYDHIIKEYPSSRYVPEAYMRIAEYYFNPPRNEINTAIDFYKKILNYRDSPKYDEALYRLGWSYYRLGNFAEAVSYFTLLADDIERAKIIDPHQRFSNPALRDESLEYIGISFLDYGGTDRAVEYLKNIGGRAYGAEILKKIGDVYMNEKEIYDKAIEAYETLLKMYPDHEQAPEIQEKIVLCYRHNKDDRMAYVSRDRLVTQFKPGSPWWQKHEDEKVRERVYQITERALRDNITLLYQRAEEKRDPDLYLQAVNDSRKYLTTFPADSMAPMIHWNMALTMDTKLHQSDQAFEEYMKIGDQYWNSKYQRYAAENAIALAKDAVESDTTRKVISEASDQQRPVRENSILNILEYKRLELTANEKRLIRAYNNFIKLYPHDPETATILTNAGALYYNNNQFAEALRYFNTMVKHFPDHRDINNVRYTILESYFGKRDFRSAEIVARRLRNVPGISQSLLDKTNKRLAESIFLAAEVLADSADHLQAGNEYLRVVKEVPNSEFADLSLFNAALQYDKAKEFSRAVETYSYLIETRANSKYLFDAMNNLAIDYAELGEPKNAALTYERLATMAKNQQQAHDALYNASLFFVKAEEWEDAIRVNRQFVEKYPTSEDADDLFYDVATYYLKLDDLEKANQIFGEYARRYPNSPRVVETYFHRGEYFQSKNDFDRAILEFQQALTKNDEFHKSKLATNDYYAAEALFRLTKIKYDQYRQIEFQLPAARMEQDKKKKRDLLIAVVDGFTKVAAFGTLRLYEATYNIGEAYEEFAHTWVRQELPPMEETRRIITMKEINQTATELYGKAEGTYKHSVTILTRLAAEYEQSLAAADSNRPANIELTRIAADDSTLRVARKWIERCKEKISEVIYDMAELNLSTVNMFLKAPIPEGLNNLTRLEYRRQILVKAVAPIVQQIVDAHIRNVRESWKMGLENQWVKFSRRKIITTNKLVADEYIALAQNSLEAYRNTLQQYVRIIDEGITSPEGMDVVSLSDQMANLSNFTKLFAKAALEIYAQTIQKAKQENINDPSVAETKEKMLQTLFDIAQQCQAIAEHTKGLRKNYERLFKETKKVDYEEAYFNFEDNYFAFRENTRELLEAGYQVSRELNISNQWVSNIMLALVQLQPEKYASLLNLQPSMEQLVTNTTWVASTSYEDGWMNARFDARHWNAALYLYDRRNVANRGQLIPIWGMASDTTGLGRDSVVVAPASHAEDVGASGKMRSEGAMNRRVFIRKHFSIPGLPVTGDIKLIVDDSYNLYVNGEYIATFTGEGALRSTEHTHQLGEYLQEGENIIAIEGIDSDGTGEGLIAIMNYQYLPGWEDKKQQIQIEVSDANIKQNLVMDKYIIY
ncbi:MAG: tetratricopeptide repeat protein [candidate division KSB1 bacterium]|nr:tetratricopeptide repeat protein [candidate division KSB1 bacterium]